jgi:hypothetical protein
LHDRVLGALVTVRISWSSAGGNPHSISFWDPVVAKVTKRLDN